jgi:hypothetical protein
MQPARAPRSGTQNLSLLSPQDFDDVYRTLIPLLDKLVSALDLRAISDGPQDDLTQRPHARLLRITGERP